MLNRKTARSSNRRGRTTFGAACALASAVAITGVALADPPTIGPQIRVDTVGGTDGANETTASASDFNPMHIVAGWNDYRSSGGVRSGFSLSLDGGATWNGFILRPPGQNQAGVEGDPMTAFDNRTGTLWAGAIAFSGNGGLYVARKNAGDNIFGAAVMADVGGGIDKCWMVAGPRPGNPDTTRLYIAYNFGLIWSDDMGQTFTNPVTLGSGIGFLPRIGPDGEIYVAYWDFGSGMKLRRSLNGGGSFSDHTIATRMDVWGTQDGSRFPGQFRVPSLIYLDVDMNTGDLYACYFDTTNVVNGQRNVDLYFTKSTNQGTSWTAPVVINTDNDPPGDQFFSWIEVDHAGRIHIVCFDSRHTEQNDGITNGMFDAYYLYSEDGGANFNEARLTPNSWNSADDGILGGGQFVGDYLGLATGGDRVYPVYIDTTNGREELYTNVIEFGPSSVASLLDFNVLRGTHTGGTLGDLNQSDQSRLRLRSEPGFTALEANVTELQVDAAMADAVTGLTVTIEVQINQPTGTATVSLRNWDTGELDVIGTHPVDFGDDVTTLIVADAGPYVRAGDGLIELHSTHAVITTLTPDGFLSRYDQIRIEGN